MKVVYLNPSGEVGGAEASLLTLITTLARQYPGFEPYVIATAGGALPQSCASLGIPFEILQLPEQLQQLGDAPTRGAGSNALVNSLGLLGGGLQLTGYLRRLKEAVQREQPDLIHSNGLKMHLMGSLLRERKDDSKVPLIGHIHDYVSRRPLAGKLLRGVSGRFRCFVANSESVARDVSASLKTDRVHTIYNAVDTERFSPSGEVMDLDQACGLPPAEPGTVRIGLAATFARWKGHPTFLRALVRLVHRHEIRGYVIGGPIYRTAGSQFSIEELQAEVAQLGLQDKVGFTGRLDNTAAALRGLDIVVHASTDPEPFGLVITEAMSCGKPTVVSNAGGAMELFEEGVTGLGHRPGDAEDLARKLEHLVRDRELRESIGRAAQSFVTKRFRPTEMGANFWRVYNGVSDQATAMSCASTSN